MTSHSLTTKYNSVPGNLAAKLVGEPYDLPDFGPIDPERLKGYRVALVTTHGPELPEFHVPVHYLRDRGALVDVITQDWLFDWQPETPGVVVLAQWLAVNVCVMADKKISDAKIKDYDTIILIGGAWNPIMLRTDESILNFIRSAHSRKLLIASICHGPQVLISANVFPRGTLATGVDDIRIDMLNAGFNVLNELVVYDEKQRLITSPNPKEPAMKAFCLEIGKRLQEQSRDFMFNENEIKSFIYHWFALFDKHVDVAHFLDLIADDGLDMQYPGARKIASHEDFKNWYLDVGNTIKSNTHTVEQIKLNHAADNRSEVDLVVLWQAVTKDDKNECLRVHQTWLLEDGKGIQRPRLLQLSSRIENTDMPVSQN